MNRSLVAALLIGVLAIAQPSVAEQILHIRKPPAATYAVLASSQRDLLLARGVHVLEDYGPFVIASAPDSTDLTTLKQETGLTAAADPDAFALDLGGVLLDTRDPGKVFAALPSDLSLADYAGTTGL
ncbi:MAG: hypothetical protein ABI768_08845 [Acidobacteriota bacterium]